MGLLLNLKLCFNNNKYWQSASDETKDCTTNLILEKLNQIVIYHLLI